MDQIQESSNDYADGGDSAAAGKGKKSGNSFILYSVGPDGKDEGGSSRWSLDGNLGDLIFHSGTTDSPDSEADKKDEGEKREKNVNPVQTETPEK